jgi:hypothetical protein
MRINFVGLSVITSNGIHAVIVGETDLGFMVEDSNGGRYDLTRQSFFIPVQI